MLLRAGELAAPTLAGHTPCISLITSHRWWPKWSPFWDAGTLTHSTCKSLIFHGRGDSADGETTLGYQAGPVSSSKSVSEGWRRPVRWRRRIPEAGAEAQEKTKDCRLWRCTRSQEITQLLDERGFPGAQPCRLRLCFCVSRPVQVSMPCFSCSDEWCEHGLASLYRAEAPEADAHKKLKHAAVAPAALTHNSSKTLYISEESTYVTHFMELQQCKYTGMRVCVSSTHEAHCNLLFIIISSHSNCSSAQNGSWGHCRWVGASVSAGPRKVTLGWKSMVSVTCTRSSFATFNVANLTEKLY